MAPKVITLIHLKLLALDHKVLELVVGIKKRRRCAGVIRFKNMIVRYVRARNKKPMFRIVLYRYFKYEAFTQNKFIYSR